MKTRWRKKRIATEEPASLPRSAFRILGDFDVSEVGTIISSGDGIVIVRAGTANTASCWS